MKTTHILQALLLFLTAGILSAQQGINYKAIIHDDDGNPLADSSISVQFLISEFNEEFGVPIPTYAETHTPTTDDNGIIIVNIGEGIPINVEFYGVFNSINWGSNPHFLTTYIDAGEGSEDMGTTEFKAVPYAFQAISAADQEYKLARQDALQGLRSDIIGTTDFQDCTADEWDMYCVDKKKITLFVADNDELILEMYFNNLQETGRIEASKEVLTYFDSEAGKTKYVDPKESYISLELNLGGYSHTFIVSPRDPLYATNYDSNYSGELDLECQLLNENMLTLTMENFDVKHITAESQGIIVSASVLDFDNCSNEVNLEVVIMNVGEIEASYIVSVRDASWPDEQTISKTEITLPYIEQTVLFKLHPENFLNDKSAGIPIGTHEIIVDIKSPNNSLYDSASVTFNVAECQ